MYHGSSSSSPSHEAPTLAVRLMSVAAEFELQARRERQRWEDKVADLKAANADLEQQNWQQSQQLEALSRKLEAAIGEMQKFSDSHVRSLSCGSPSTHPPPPPSHTPAHQSPPPYHSLSPDDP
jgi:hypothetical protein